MSQENEFTLTPDWTLLEQPGVEEVIERVVQSMDSRFTLDMDRDDMLHEATLLVVTKANLRSSVERYELGLLYHGLRSDLFDLARKQIRRRALNSSYEGLREDQEVPSEYIKGLRDEEDFEARPPETEPVVRSGASIPPPSSSYPRELVEHLLPAVWDRDCDYGMRNPYAPEPGMPKAAVNLKESGTLCAHLADIRTAWVKAPLLIEHRRALLLCYGLDWTHEEIAFNQGAPRRTITSRIERGVGIITDHLNGTDFSQFESAADKENEAA